MGYAELLAQLQQNAAKTKERREEASVSLAQAAQQVAAQAAEMVPGRPGRNPGGGGGPSDAPMVGLNKGQPAPGDVNVHSSGYSNYAADINVPGRGDFGNPVAAYKPGKVIDVQRWKNSYGKHVKIRHPNGTETLYAHLSGINVKPGQRVKKGQQIGKVGNSGNSSGPHLHFEIR